MSLWLVNSSAENYEISDLQLTIPAGDSYDLTLKQVDAVRSSNGLLLAIGRQDLVLNDGLQDLEPIEAIYVIFGGIRKLAGGFINDNAVGDNILWSALKLTEDLANKSDIDHGHSHSVIVDDEPEKHFPIDDVNAALTSVYSSDKTQTLADGKSNLDHTHIESEITDLKDYVESTRTIITSTGLSGGGALSSNLTLSIVPGDISHLDIQDIGSNSHVSIDYHISDLLVHRVIDNNSSLDTDLFSALEIITRLGTKEGSLCYTPEDVANKG